MPGKQLKDLPTEVKVLINNGVYSLYSVKNRPGVAYVLLTTAKNVFPLTVDGNVVPEIVIQISDVELGPPVFFNELEPPPAMKLNYA